jgi:hypothetical protein
MVGGTFVQLGYLAHGRGKWEHQLSYVYNHGFLSWDQEAVVPRTSTMKRTDRCKPSDSSLHTVLILLSLLHVVAQHNALGLCPTAIQTKFSMS